MNHIKRKKYQILLMLLLSSFSVVCAQKKKKRPEKKEFIFHTQWHIDQIDCKKCLGLVTNQLELKLPDFHIEVGTWNEADSHAIIHADAQRMLACQETAHLFEWCIDNHYQISSIHGNWKGVVQADKAGAVFFVPTDCAQKIPVSQFIGRAEQLQENEEFTVRKRKQRFINGSLWYDAKKKIVWFTIDSSRTHDDTQLRMNI